MSDPAGDGDLCSTISDLKNRLMRILNFQKAEAAAQAHCDRKRSLQ